MALSSPGRARTRRRCWRIEWRRHPLRRRSKRIMLATFAPRGGGARRPRRNGCLPAVSRPRRPSRRRGSCENVHGLGARLWRDDATCLGLDPESTIDDREDSADLMTGGAMKRASAIEERLPTKAYVPDDRSCVVKVQAILTRRSEDGRWAPRTRTCCGWLFASTSRPSNARTCSITTISCLFRRDAGRAGDRGGGRRAFRSFAGRRIPGHQRSPGRDRAALEAFGARPDRGRRRRPGDLLFRAATVRNILDFPARSIRRRVW